MFALAVMIAALLAGVAGLPLVTGVGVVTIGAVLISRAMHRRRIRPR